MAKQVRLYLLFVALVAALVLTRWEDPDGPPRRSTAPLLDLQIEGLESPATAERFGFSAESARPRQGSTSVTLGGYLEGLDLQSITVSLGEGHSLLASEGELVGKRLTLRGKVWIEHAGERRLSAARAVLSGRHTRFPGHVVFHRSSGDEREFDLSLDQDQLLARLR